MNAVRPVLVIVGGINGSGKSTLARGASGTDLLLSQSTINPDDLSRQALVEFPALNEAGANLAGAERAEKAVWRAIAESRSVAVETVLSSDKFVPVVTAARKRRYRVRLIFVGLPTVEEALARIATRVELGGHSVPEDRVRRRWNAAHDNLILFLPLVDDVIVLSNVGTTPVLVAERTGRAAPIRLLDPDALPDVTKRLRPGAQ